MLTTDPFISLMLYSLCFGASCRRLAGHAAAVARLDPSAYSSGAVCCIFAFIYSAVSYALDIGADGGILALCVYFMLIAQHSPDDSKSKYEPAIFSLQAILSGVAGVINTALTNSVKEGVHSLFCTFLFTAAVRAISAQNRPIINNLLNP